MRRHLRTGKAILPGCRSQAADPGEPFRRHEGMRSKGESQPVLLRDAGRGCKGVWTPARMHNGGCCSPCRRFGGLRCPSEHLALTWEDMDWEHDRMTVRSPKTERHEGKESRIIPIFPELRPYLEAVFNAAETRLGGPHGHGTRHHAVSGRNANLRTQLTDHPAGGLEPWPKLFQNLRSTRETELAAELPHPRRLRLDRQSAR